MNELKCPWCDFKCLDIRDIQDHILNEHRPELLRYVEERMLFEDKQERREHGKANSKTNSIQGGTGEEEISKTA